MSRLDRAIDAVCQAIETVSQIPAAKIERDDDFKADIGLDPLELESLGLIIEEIFSIRIDPEHLFASPIYRTPASLAEYCIRHSELASWAESRREPARRRA